MVDRLELVISGGEVVTPAGVYEADVGIADGRIAALAAPDTLSGAERLNATGLHIFPGVIDLHTHPGNWRPFEQDIAEETRAAAAGGITSILGTVKSPRLGQPFREVTTPEDVCSYHDVFPLAREIPEYAEQHGVRSFKFFIGNAGATSWHGRVGMPVFGDDSVSFAAFREAGRIGALTMVHAENQHVARVLRSALDGEPADLQAWNRHSPDWAEAETIRRSAFFAAAGSSNLYVVHLTSGLGAAEVRRAKAERPGRVFAETCPQYLVLHDRHRADLLAKCSPPVRTGEDNEVLWRALEDGTIDCVGTDHIPQSRAHKVVEGDVWRSIAGMPGHETLVPLLLAAERLSLPRLAEVTSANAARIFGLWPRKGSVAPGADADLTLIDLKKRRVVRAEDLITSADFTPYEEMELRGWPVLTLLGGRVVMRESQPVGEPVGEYLWRKAE